MFTASAFFTVETGELTIVGDAADNTIVVSRDPAGVIRVNGGGIQVLGEIPTVANTVRMRISGQAGNDILSLDEANGTLPPVEISGGAGNDTLIGGSGADILTGGSGDDQVFGNAGNDRSIWSSGDGSDLIEGGAGVDTIEINGGDAGEAFLATSVDDRILFERIDPSPFSLDIGASENLIVNMNGGNDTFAADGNLSGLFVDGGAGNDTIIGGAGNDRLVGGDGNDFIDGNAGNDMVFLDAGDDTFRWDLGDASDVVDGGAGNDRMLFNGSNTSEGIDVTANGERVLFFRNLGSINMDLNEVERVDFNALGGADTITVGDLSGTDLTELNINLKAGEGGGDLLTDSVIVNATGREDNVEVTGTGSFYSVLGLPTVINVGNSEGALDHLVVQLGDGNDTFSAEALAAGVAILSVDGGAGDDFVLGSQGPDTFIWNPGDGSDTVEGQAGQDTLQFKGSDLAENFDLSANGNRVRFLRAVENAADVSIDLHGVEQIDLSAQGGTDTITVNDLSPTDLVALNLDLDSALGTGFGDNASDSIIINGTAGDDAIQIASFGARVAIGGVFPFVNITGEDGLDTLTVNTLSGDDGVDAANLSATNASQFVRLTINGGTGNDTIGGSQGFDTFVWNSGDGNDTIEGGPGEDSIVINGSNAPESFAFSASGNRVRLAHDLDAAAIDFGNVEILTVNPLAGADNVTVDNLTGTAVTRINLNLSGTEGGAAGDGHGDSIVINGTSDADLIPVQGTAAGILVNGGFASQHGLPYFTFIRSVEPTDALRINGGGGDDTIDAVTLETPVIFTADGGAGNDQLKGSSHDDLLIGGDGDDFIDGNQGVDIGLLGAGRDTFLWDPGDGSDVVEGQEGSDKLVFNGADAAEIIEITTIGNRVSFHRDPGNITMELNGIEEADFNALGGADNITINDLFATDLSVVNLDLRNANGGGDGQADTIVVNGTNGGDELEIASFGNGTGIGLAGSLFPFVNITDAEGTNDRLTVNTFNGDDSLIVDTGVSTSLGVTQLIYNAGSGANTLSLTGSNARIDSTATGGTLDTAVHAGVHLSTNRLMQNSLALEGNSEVTLLAGGDTSRLTSLAIGTGARLDLTDNALVIDYTGTSPEAEVRQKILAGRGGSGLGKSWTGTGITSSAAAEANAIEPELRSVGYAENSELPLGAQTTFRGLPVDNTSVLLAFTRTGDANLDGVVNNDDATILGATFAPGVANPAWALGDFDYDGFVANDDVTLLGAFFNPSAEPLLTEEQGITATEPPPALPNSKSRAIDSGTQRLNDHGHLIDLLAESILSNQRGREVDLAHVPFVAERQSATADSIWASW
jgi:Ca2+-binding RTX toxin-like protein